jgi:hypothetical protein
MASLTLAEHLPLVAAGLELADTMQTDCPLCGKPKLSITRTPTGLLYNCFTATCDTRGHLGADNVARAPAKHKPNPSDKLTPYNGATRLLNAEECARFWVHNQLLPAQLESIGRFRWAPDDGAYAFPIIDPYGHERGLSLRFYDGRKRKSLHFTSTPGPVISWYWHGDSKRVILVEDPVSAVKLAALGFSAVALLGTSMSPEGAWEVASMKPERVTLALDEDAADAMARLKKWYGLLWAQVDCVYLRKDVKDMSWAAIRELFA